MSLFGNLFGGGKDKIVPPPRQEPDIALPDFTVDRGRMFDLAKTQRLQQVLATASDSWNEEMFPLAQFAA